MLVKEFTCDLKEMDAAGEFTAYAATFGNLDRQGDRIAREAFTDSIAETKGKYPFLMAHDTGRIVGWGTSAEQDNKGLLVTGELILDTDEGRNAYAIMRKAKQLKVPLGFSIGYSIPDGGSKRDEKTGIRTLTKITLYEFSIAVVPANPRAGMVDVKSALDWTVREFEAQLVAMGFDHTAAKTICAKGFTAVARQRDVDGAAAGTDEQRDVAADDLRLLFEKANATYLMNELIRRV